MLTVVRPSPLRLWGFVLTVAGGGLLAFGSIADWAAVSLGGSTENAVPTKGIDLWQGLATAALGLLIVFGILALRFAPARRRNAVASAITAFAVLALGLVVWCLVALDSIVLDSGIDALVGSIVAQLGVTEAQARELLAQAQETAGIEVRAQAGLWIATAGAVLSTIGGLVDLAWVRRKRLAGDAIDVDTLPDATSSPGDEPGA